MRNGENPEQGHEQRGPGKILVNPVTFKTPMSWSGVFQTEPVTEISERVMDILFQKPVWFGTQPRTVIVGMTLRGVVWV